MKSLNKTEKIISVINLVCCAFGLVLTLIQMFTNRLDVSVIIKSIMVIIGYLGIFYYVFIGYKKPHGNSLKYAMLFVVAILILVACTNPVLKGQKMNGMLPYAAEVPDGPVFSEPNLPENVRPLFDTPYANVINFAIIFFTVMILSYVAGRLGRVEENKKFLIAALVFLLFRCFLDFYPGKYPVYANEFNMVLAVVSGYLVRYRQHKDAGLDVEQKQ